MADPVYDPEKKDANPLTPDDIREMEERHAAVDRDIAEYAKKSDKKIKRDEKRAMEGKDTESEDLRERYMQKEAEEDQQLQARVKDLFKEEPADSPLRQGKAMKTSGTKKRLLIALAGLGIPALFLGMAFLPGIFGVLKIQNFFENIDVATASRFNAQFSNRSDRWLKAYIQLRLTELDGATNPGNDTLYFRANRIDTDHPIRDWYKTMRLSKFEDELAKDGIFFTSTSTTNPDGSVTLGFGEIRIEGVDEDGRVNLGNGTIDTNSAAARQNLLATLNRTDATSLNGRIDARLFDGPGSNREARAIIKNAVNDRTQKWEVFKRRQLRKGIQNMTGVRSWRLFETTRDRIDRRTLSIQRKILNAVLPENRTGNFIKCIFGAGPCPSTSDPASAEARNSGGLSDASNTDSDNTSEDVNENGDIETEQVDSNGDGILETQNSTNSDNTPGIVSDEIAEETGQAVAGEAAEEGTEAAAKHVIRDMVSKIVGNPYTKLWSWLKKLARMDSLFSDGKLVSLVVNAKRYQYMMAFTQASIGLSQLKTGDLVNTNLFKYTTPANDSASLFAQATPDTVDNGQISEFMSFYEGQEKSEAWMLFGNGKVKASTAQALALEDQGRSAYCDMSPEEKKLQPIYYKCPDDDLGSSNAQRLTDSYNKSVGRILSPIADAVEAVESSFLGRIASAVESVADDITSPIINGVMGATGLDKTIEGFATAGMTKVMDWSGAGVKYVPGNAGELNYQMMGAALSIESTARQLGAVSTDSFAYLRGYTTNLVEDWQAEQREDMSLYDRYASLNNPRSFASTALMALGTSTPDSLVDNFSSPVDTFNNYASAFGGDTAYAAEDTYAVSEWMGSKTYDIPKECFDLDPLDPEYYQKVTNAPAEVSRTKALLEDSEAFWDAVYAALPGSTNGEKEEAAEGIYNCALFDRSVRGSIGYLFDYNDDGGLDSGGGANTGNAASGIAALNGPALPCTGQPAAARRLSGPRADWSGITPTGSIGQNSAGQPINVYVRAACSTANVRTVVIAGSIHGSENGGQLVGWEMLFNAQLPENVRVVVIPEINGVGIPNSRRKNGNEVDLNRNFDYNWGAGGSGSCSESVVSCMFYRGPSAGSEPETQALTTFLTQLGRVDLFLIYHDNLNYVATVGDTPANYGTTYSATSGLRNNGVVNQHGSLDAWYNSTVHTPTILVELGNDQSQAVIDRNVNAVRDVLAL